MNGGTVTGFSHMAHWGKEIVHLGDVWSDGKQWNYLVDGEEEPRGGCATKQEAMAALKQTAYLLRVCTVDV